MEKKKMAKVVAHIKLKNVTNRMGLQHFKQRRCTQITMKSNQKFHAHMTH